MVNDGFTNPLCSFVLYSELRGFGFGTIDGGHRSPQWVDEKTKGGGMQ